MDIFERLVEVCTAVFDGDINVEGISLESSLREDIGINSVGLLYMAMALEDEFDIKFCNDDFLEIRTVGDVIRTIEEKVG